MNTYDWIKAASTALTEPNDKDIENAFCEQATAVAGNKLGPLLNAPYRLGFEIVKKNDDNTRMVGIFGFKIDNNLVYAPVFFINGEIKGLCLYDYKTKSFMPATEERAMYLISDAEHAEGKPFPREGLKHTQPHVRMERLTFDGNNSSRDVTKSASLSSKAEVSLKAIAGDDNKVSLISMPVYDDMLLTGRGDGTSSIKTCGCEKVLTKSDIDLFGQCEKGAIKCVTIDMGRDGVDIKIDKKACSEILDQLEKSAASNEDWMDSLVSQIDAGTNADRGVIFKDFMSEPGIGDQVLELITKAASGREGGAFASALANLYDSPEVLVKAAAISKEAAGTLKEPKENKSTSESSITIHYEPNEAMISDPKNEERFFADGFCVVDKRDADELATVEMTPNTYTREVTTPGVYKVLCEDGSLEDGSFVTPANSQRWRSASGEYAVIDRNNKLCVDSSSSVYGIIDGEKDEGPSKSDSLSGKHLFVVAPKDNSGKAYFVYTTNVRDIDGVQKAEVMHYGVDGPGRLGYTFSSTGGVAEKFEDNPSIILNRDLSKSDLKNGVIGDDMMLFKISDADFGSERNDKGAPYNIYTGSFKQKFIKGGTLDHWCDTHLAADKKSIRKVDGDLFTITDKDTIIAEVTTKEAAMRKLACNMSIHSEYAYALLDAASECDEVEFTVSAPKIAKRASVRVVGEANFDESNDSELGVRRVETQSRKLPIQTDRPRPKDSRIGDSVDPASSTGLPSLSLLTTPPEELRSLADAYDRPNVFEHAMVGTLANSANAIELVNKYLKRIDSGVDVLGRIKFLLHWMPSAFESEYGKDDMTNLEAQIDNNFNSLGELSLKLHKQSTRRKSVNSAKEQ